MRPMRAAIYARRSTEEHQAASLETQVGEARRWCEARGWSVADAHVFVDSGVSRAEFKHRPGLVALLLAAERRDFDAVVVRDASRLGGDMERTALLIRDLVESGTEVWNYYEGTRAEADSITARLLLIVRAFAEELEREKIAGRTRERLERGARAGHVVGGSVYGYDNVPVMDGARRVRVEYAINEREAAVVREVFRRYADGEGLRPIAADLNARRVPSPHAGRRGTGSWGPTSLHDLLRRERYRGSLVWGWRGTAYRKGTRVEIRRPAAQWTRAERPDLAIVDAELWTAVHDRIAAEARGGTWRHGREPKSLLAGIARCAACGGPMHMRPARFGSTRIPVYQCAWAHERGPAVCTNKVQRPAAELDDALLGWIRARVLDEAALADILDEARTAYEAAAATAPSAPADAARVALERDLARVQAELTRFTAAIASTDGPVEVLARAVAEREARAKELRRELAAATAAAPTTAARAAWATLANAARARLRELGAMFAASVTEGRAALKALLAGPVTCALVKAARGHRYLLTGTVVVPGLELLTPGVFASPTAPEQSRGDRVELPFKVRADRRAA
jgi:site-specific DNA recombinase